MSIDDRAGVASSSREDERPQRGPYLITEEMLQNRLERENKGRFITQLACAVSANMAALTFGALLGWSGCNSPKYLKRYNLTEENYGWVASLMPLGCSVGITPWMYGINNLGPKHTMILQTPFYILTLLVMATLHGFETWLIGRFFSGFLSVSYFMCGERLLKDSVHAGYLPLMTACFRTSVMVGVTLSFLTGHFWSRANLTIMCASFPVINVLFLFILPESPVFLFDKNERKAESALCWYRGRTNIYMAMQCIRKDSEIRKIGVESYRYMMYSKVVMKALLIITGLNFFRVYSGYYVFIFYNAILWTEFADTFDDFIDGIVFCSCLCISDFAANLFHYRSSYGARKPLITSTVFLSITVTVLAIYAFLHEEEMLIKNPKRFNWIPLATVSTIVVCYRIGLGAYSDTLLYDYLPYQVHTQAKNISEVLYWFHIFFLVKYFMTIKTLTAYYVNFSIMAFISYVSIFYCYTCIIETKGKNLIQIQIEIGGNPVGNRAAYQHRM